MEVVLLVFAVPVILLAGWFIKRNWIWFAVWATIATVPTLFWVFQPTDIFNLREFFIVVYAAAAALGGIIQLARLIIQGPKRDVDLSVEEF